MAGFLNKITKFARSPQGQQLITKAQQAAKDPATRAKIQDAAGKISSRKGKQP